MNRKIGLVLLALLVHGAAMGCSRTRYRTAADRDAYCIVQEKSNYLSEEVPDNFTVRPDQRSRFYDPTNPDCPQLPVPRPVLRGYDLPPLASDALNPMPSQATVPSMADAAVSSGNTAGVGQSPALPPEPVPPPPAQPTVPETKPNSPPPLPVPPPSGSATIELTSANMPFIGYGSSMQPVVTTAFEPPIAPEGDKDKSQAESQESSGLIQASATSFGSCEQGHHSGQSLGGVTSNLHRSHVGVPIAAR